jgi:preprotein translocase subunit SecE
VTDSKAVRGPRERSASEKRTSIPTFYRQVVAELRKVVWPTQEQLVTYFIVVMVFVAVMMTLVSLLDLGLGKLAFEVFDGRSAQ